MPNATAALKIRDIRLFLAATAFFTLAGRALLVVIGFQIYQITHSALALGWLGLIEAIPAISLMFFGGVVADHFNRRRILLITRAASFLFGTVLVYLTVESAAASVAGLYVVIFLAGIARGFADPASAAFEAQIVPKPLTVNASSWITSTWIICAVLGPAAIGFIYDAHCPAGSYGVITACFFLSWICTVAISPKSHSKPENKDPIFKSITVGWHFVMTNEPLLAALADRKSVV